MNRILPLFLIGLIAVFTTCEEDKNPPTADFTHSSDTYEAGDTVEFTNNSIGATSYSWDFDDGRISTAENPIHVFNSAGSYEVTLKVTNSDGSREKSETINIKEATILELVTYESANEYLVPNAAILMYDNESDWENIADDMAGWGFTDASGEIQFMHISPIKYWIWAFKEVSGGSLMGGGSLTVDANTTTRIGVPMEFFSSTKSAGEVLELYKESVLENR